ncbi:MULTISPECIES: hypothetical protein [Prochlorococcus]|uniref:Uncharacterized protein n=1 Tax=Prochlorococcus marinus (strain SARG / CCMP1375 / SS120) TaxID=167539 RepID=Q7VC96_PROMA|nr:MULTISPECIES: hypothetical protein [Prochlorococcus]AAP99890.1 Uncharacterized protein Pro_0846 [Prochlorococcus marinus subsp. marinus str. CCMP1375]KGG11763.1 hypothetical protein EV04_0788 [Prochlorococcus marinus str. LG]KGG18823.1 hypothetical protein EV08_1309 [Prochlorococcus marinus str. SS2]KGG23639.1 hypothetical protein EV09_1264 [Prochlorococcus marinus str. SS35]KGG32125.1 hypothetical protein EV10_1239 [Prochlorococcus marinus str. SS51]
MHILDSDNDLITEIAKACDLCMKPWRHSVVDNSPKSTPSSEDDFLDMTLRVECRDEDGERLPENDLELEIFKSGDDLSITLAWLSFPDRQILWHGKHSIWMDSESGKRSTMPNGGSCLEALARRIRALFDFESEY